MGSLREPSARSVFVNIGQYFVRIGLSPCAGHSAAYIRIGFGPFTVTLSYLVPMGFIILTVICALFGASLGVYFVSRFCGHDLEEVWDRSVSMHGVCTGTGRSARPE